ncbi:MAG: outer membrane beta-barrel protein [Burkholderiaceae bacterium]|nr:outer membrane beta-barrel protein [Burkholderiaceae bacterium]
MKKILLAVALSSLSVAASAEGWKFAPGLTEPGFKYEPSIALTASSIKPHGADSATAYGVDINFNCGLIQTPDNRMRTHFSVSRVNEDQYGATIVELSPRYTVPLADGFSIGAGPSLGAVRLNVAAAGVPTETVFAYGVVAGLNYRKGALYAGLDLGARRTKEKSGLDFDSRAVTLKVGYNF